jgi:hypothetical protein
LQSIIGKTHFVRSLRTGRLNEALRQARTVGGEFEALLLRAEAGVCSLKLEHREPEFQNAQSIQLMGEPIKKAGKTLERVFEMFINDPTRKRAKKTISGYHEAMEVIYDVIGHDKFVSDIDREVCRKLLETLQWLPTNSSKRFPNLTCVAASAMAKKKRMTETLSPVTVNGYLNFKGEVQNKFDPKNPHFDLKIPAEFEPIKAEIVDEISRKLFKNRIANARDRRELKFRKEVQLSPDFTELWDKIKDRTRYRVKFETADLIERAVKRIKVNIETIRAPRIATTVVELDISDAGVSTDTQIATRVRNAEQVYVLPDILAFLQKETELTRHTLAEILKLSGRLAEFKLNPQAFMAAVSKEVSSALHDLMLEGILGRTIPTGHSSLNKMKSCILFVKPRARLIAMNGGQKRTRR